MKASKELLTFVLAESLMFKNFYESDMNEVERIRKANGSKEALQDHLKEAALNESIYSALDRIYTYLSDQEAFNEEKQLLKDTGIWERVPGKHGERLNSYWKQAEEEMKKAL